MVTAVNFYFYLLTTLVIVNFLALLVALYMFYWVRRLVKLSKKSITIERGAEGKIVETLSQVGQSALVKIIDEHARDFKIQSSEYFGKMDKALSTNIRDLGQFTKKQEDLVIKQSEYAVERLIAKTVEEIEQYKEYQMRRMDGEAANVVEKVIREVLSRAITVEEQEELVRDALKRAKAEGIFDQTMRSKIALSAPKLSHKGVGASSEGVDLTGSSAKVLKFSKNGKSGL